MLHLAAEEVVHRRRRALVRDVQQVDVRHQLEELRGQVRRAAGAVGGEGQPVRASPSRARSAPARCSPAPRDARRGGGCSPPSAPPARSRATRSHEQVRHQRGVDRASRRSPPAACSRRRGDFATDLGADVAAGAGAVLDDERLAEDLRHLRRRRCARRCPCRRPAGTARPRGSAWTGRFARARAVRGDCSARSGESRRSSSLISRKLH